VKIYWLTPVHSRSAIAQFSEVVVRRLVEKGCQVTIASTESDVDLSQRRRFLDLPIKPFDASNVANFDVIIANFGDHYPNHERSLDALPFARVIGIFHDADMSNFGNGLRAAGRVLDGKDVVSAIASACAGAVSHSDFYLPAMFSCDGPVETIPLAWSLPKGTVTRTFSPKKHYPSRDKFRLITFGNINRNKCADRVIQAIADSTQLSNIIDYRLVGAIEPVEQKRLEALATKGQVNLSILGSVDDDRLHQELREADMISCLREPVLEGASASAIEAMLHGCAVLVSDAGFYADLPDDCVVKVPEKTLSIDIRKALENFVEKPALGIEMGKRARAFAEMAFSPNKYADMLLILVENVRVTSVYEPVLLSVTDHLFKLGIKPNSEPVEIVLRALEGMAPVDRRSNNNDDQQKKSDTLKPMKVIT
jgi:glycosyltransferase involved in cell wall biosynthesis